MKTKSIKTLLLLFLSAGMMTSCGGGTLQSSSEEDTSKITEDTSEIDTSEIDSSDVSTGDTEDQSSSEEVTSEESSSSEEVESTWPLDILEEMHRILDGVTLPYVEAEWELADLGLDFGVLGAGTTLEEVDAAFVAADWEESDAITGATYCYAIESENGMVAAGLLAYNEYVAVAAFFEAAPSTEWSAADIELMQDNLFGVTIPHPAGLWAAPYVTSNGSIVTYTEDTDATEEAVAEFLGDNGFAVAVASDNDGYEFTIVAPEDYQGETVYVNGYVYTRSTGVIIQAFPNLEPMVSYNITIDADKELVHAGDEVELTVTLGNAFNGDEEVAFVIDPEGAATLNADKTTGNKYVFTIAENVEADTVITFTASVEGVESTGTVSITVAGADVRFDWTAEEKLLMETYLNFEIPFLGDNWHVTEVYDEIYEENTAAIRSDATGAAEAAFALFLELGYTYRTFEGYGDFIVLKVLPEEGESFTPFVYYLAILDNEEYSEVVIGGFDDYASDWADADKDLMAEHLAGKELPFLPGVYDSFYYYAAQDLIFSYSYTLSLEEYHAALVGCGYEFVESYYGNYYEFVLDEYRSIIVQLDVMTTTDNCLQIIAYLYDITPNTADSMHLDEIKAFYAENGIELTAAQLPEFTSETATFEFDDSYAVYGGVDEYISNTTHKEVEDYVAELVKGGWTLVQQQEEEGEVYYKLELDTGADEYIAQLSIYDWLDDADYNYVDLYFKTVARPVEDVTSTELPTSALDAIVPGASSVLPTFEGATEYRVHKYSDGYAELYITFASEEAAQTFYEGLEALFTGAGFTVTSGLSGNFFISADGSIGVMPYGITGAVIELDIAYMA